MKLSGNILVSVFEWAAVCVILICLTAAMNASAGSRKAQLCTGMDICIRDSTENRFVSPGDIAGYVSADYGQVTGIPVMELDLKRMETVLDSRSAILKSEAYCTKDGVLHIDVTQREPVMRFQKGGQGFYADERGYVFPLKPGKASYVIVIDGNIPIETEDAGKGKAVSGKEKEWLDRMGTMVSYMNRHKVWNRSIVQIHVSDNGDLILIPREGREKFIFGKPEKIEEKFELMELYYSAVVPSGEKDRYGTVDVRYDKQIICK